MTLKVKICGITDDTALQTAIEAGASYVGLVFYALSPRNVSVELARRLAASVPAHIIPVGLFVDPEPAQIQAILNKVPLRMIQLHGKETPTAVQNIHRVTGLPVMKALGIRHAEDFGPLGAYESVADMLLFDAKPSSKTLLPGGNAESFDWTLLKGRSFRKPWMLAGGLHAGNLENAVKQSGALIVDVSSGVEDRPGHKDSGKIRAFMDIAKRL